MQYIDIKELRFSSQNMLALLVRACETSANNFTAVSSISEMMVMKGHTQALPALLSRILLSDTFLFL